MVKYVLSSPWDSEKRNFDLFVCLVHVKKLTIKLTLTLTLTNLVISFLIIHMWFTLPSGGFLNKLHITRVKYKNNNRLAFNSKISDRNNAAIDRIYNLGRLFKMDFRPTCSGFRKVFKPFHLKIKS